MLYAYMGSENKERYQLVEADLKMFSRSGVRSKIMLILLEGGRTVGELEKITNTRSTTLLHSIKDLIDLDLVEKKHQVYNLTNIGRIQAVALEDLLNTIITINQHHKFWRYHDLSSIPLELQKSIGMLGRGEIMEDAPETPLKLWEDFINSLVRARVIRSVTSIIIKGFITAIPKAIENGADVEIIVTNTVLEAISKWKDKDYINKNLKKDNFKLFLIDCDVKISFTMTESFLKLGLANIDGSFDLGTDVMYRGEKPVMWGRMFYDYYKRQSTRIFNLE
jgi:predicted transcriptional regulator